MTDAIIAQYGPTLTMPTTRERCQIISQGFFNIGGFPNIIGCVDGSLIPIIRPVENEHIYVSRKGFHAINAMVVCNANLEIMYADTRFSGATQDAGVYRESSLRQAFITGRIPQGCLLGDSGYGLSANLLTPINNPRDRAEIDYNIAHRTTRNVIERCFGVLKSRFRCIDKSGGPLRLSPTKSARVIAAVMLLHNKALEFRLELEPNEMLAADVDDNEHVVVNGDEAACAVRNHIVHFFRR